jgi:hypothetical protein
MKSKELLPIFVQAGEHLQARKQSRETQKKELAFLTFYRSSLNMAMEVGHLKSPHLDRRMIAVTTARPR